MSFANAMCFVGLGFLVLGLVSIMVAIPRESNWLAATTVVCWLTGIIIIGMFVNQADNDNLQGAYTRCESRGGTIEMVDGGPYCIVHTRTP